MSDIQWVPVREDEPDGVAVAVLHHLGALTMQLVRFPDGHRMISALGNNSDQLIRLRRADGTIFHIIGGGYAESFHPPRIDYTDGITAA